MIQIHKNFAIAVVFVLLVYSQITQLQAAKPSNGLCPIGFLVAYDGHDPVCYRKKGPEPFAEKFNNCTGNRFTIKLLQRLNILSPKLTIWTDYKNLYDGGPFVDWSYTKTSGELLESTLDVKRDPMYDVNGELCVVIDPVLNFTAVRCDEKHHRYCFVDAYKDPNKMNAKGCKSLNNLIAPDASFSPNEVLRRRPYRFWSPTPTCLLEAMPQRGNSVRMTWDQSQKACELKGGSLLNRGWRYSNYPLFTDNNDRDPLFPFGVRLSTNLTLLRYDTKHDSALIPQSEWLFKDTLSNDARLGAVQGDSWELVNNSSTFFDVICEQTVPLKHVNMILFIDTHDDNIILTIDDKDLKKSKILCFTDSNGIDAEQVKISKNLNGRPGFILKFIQDGYYWCTHTDSENFYISDSNRLLKIKVKEETENLYAVKLTSLAHDYDLDNIGALVQNDWKNKIEEYVHYSTKYKKTYGPLDAYDNHTIWKYKNDWPDLDIKNAHVILKRLYLDSRTALLHVDLHPTMLPVTGQWGDIVIDSMKPAYYCEKDEHFPDRLALDESRVAPLCKLYNCTGNFNEGVQLVMTHDDTCYTPKPLNVSSSAIVLDITTTTTEMVPVVMGAVEVPFTATTEKTTRQKTHLELSSSESSEEDATVPSSITYEEIIEDVIIESSTTVSEDSGDESGEDTDFSIPPESVIIYPPFPPWPTSTPAPVMTGIPTFPPTTTPSPLLPEQNLDLVLTELTELLDNSTDPILMTDIETSFEKVDGFLAETEELEIPGDLLHVLDRLGARIALNGTDHAANVKGNVALMVADAQPASPVLGLKIAAGQMDMFVANAFNFIRDDINNSHLMADNNQVVIQLPESVAYSYRRISFVVFRNDRAFQSSHGLYSVNSVVLSINVENTTEFENGEAIDIYLSPLNDTKRNESRSCAYWKFLDDGSGNGYWAQDGCTFVPSTVDGMLDACRCDHLTHFAEVLVPRTVFSERNENTLEIISIVGCFMSIFGLILVGVTALMFRSWRRDYSNKIWMQLCISIFIMSLSFLVIIFAHFEEYDVLCMLTGIFLHFSVLSSFCWMLVAAVLSYRRLVTVFTIEASHKLLRASAFAWGVPCAVVGIVLSIAPHSYSGRFDEKNPTAAFCYPSGLALWLSVFAPLALMLVVNWTLFALIVRSVFASRRNRPHVGSRHSGDKHEALRCASVSFFLVFLFGLPWLLGLFSMNVVMAYFFVFLSTFQGFVLFLFFVLGNKKTRDLWLNKLKIKQTRKIPVTSSSYSNNRSIAVNNAGNVNSRSDNKPDTIETKISKPRSLVSLDDSRFS